jgi:hypothetical protein
MLFVAIVWLQLGATSAGQSAPIAPDMPDESHRLLAAQAAQSHGLAEPLLEWLAQGAWDEDHCQFEPYPPCLPWIPNGYHSWDPDTDEYWTEPAWWPEFGSGLTHINWLFDRAVNAQDSGDTEAAFRYLGRAVHMLGDMATPAHVNLDTHLPPFDTDPYEIWLGEDNLSNTRAWIEQHPAGQEWNLAYYSLPSWAELGLDLQGQLEAASQIYGGRESGQALWLLGPEEQDPVVFRLMFLMAEEADNWDSDDVLGEQYHGDLEDPVYLTQMRDALFPKLVPYSAALIDYFESRTATCPGCRLFLPVVISNHIPASETSRQLRHTFPRWLHSMAARLGHHPLRPHSWRRGLFLPATRAPLHRQRGGAYGSTPFG